MGQALDAGEPLVHSLEKGIAGAQVPRVKRALEDMLESWGKTQDILPPAQKAHDVFPRSAYGLTMAGFAAGLLDPAWQKAADLLDWSLGEHAMEASFCMTVGVLLENGVSFPFALDAWSEDNGSAAAQALVPEIKEAMLKGHSIAPVLARHPDVFSKQLIDLVARTEADGTLDKALVPFAREHDRRSPRRRNYSPD